MHKTRRQLTYEGLLIKNRLMELNMTQKDLAGKLQMSNGYLTDIVRGRRSGEKYMDRIFRELNIEDRGKKNNLTEYGKNREKAEDAF